MPFGERKICLIPFIQIMACGVVDVWWFKALLEDRNYLPFPQINYHASRKRRS